MTLQTPWKGLRDPQGPLDHILRPSALNKRWEEFLKMGNKAKSILKE